VETGKVYLSFLVDQSIMQAHGCRLTSDLQCSAPSASHQFVT